MKIQLFGDNAKTLKDCKSALFVVEHTTIDGHDIVQLELADTSGASPFSEEQK